MVSSSRIQNSCKDNSQRLILIIFNNSCREHMEIKSVIARWKLLQIKTINLIISTLIFFSRKCRTTAFHFIKKKANKCPKKGSRKQPRYNPRMHPTQAMLDQYAD